MNSTTIWTFLTSDRLLSSNESLQIKKPVPSQAKSPMASPAKLLNKRTLKEFLPKTEGTGASKIAVITLLTGTMMKTGAAYVSGMALKILPDYDVLPLA